MLDNTISHSIVAGLRGAEQAQRIANPAGWARQALEHVAAPRVAARDGETSSRSERALDTLTSLRNAKPCAWVSTAIDSVVGSGVHTPVQHSPLTRAAYKVSTFKAESHQSIKASLQHRFDVMLANPSSVGVLGLGVGLVQFIPAAMAGIATTAIGAAVGSIADIANKGYTTLRGTQVVANHTRTAASWGAYLGTGAGVLAAATFLPVVVASPVVAGAAIAFWAPNLALQALRGINTAARAVTLGVTFGAAYGCHAAADVAGFARGKVQAMHARRTQSVETPAPDLGTGSRLTELPPECEDAIDGLSDRKSPSIVDESEAEDAQAA